MNAEACIDVKSDCLVYAPDGWKTKLPENNGWHSADLLAAEKSKWGYFLELLQEPRPLGFSHEDVDPRTQTRNASFHNIHMSYAYVVSRALADNGGRCLSILDWGGGLGHYHNLAVSLFPNADIFFSCKETAPMVKIGEDVNPFVHWYSGDSYLNQTYDIVMMNGSLQYIENWQELLQQLAKITDGYFFLTRLPVVEKSPSFVAIQRFCGTEMLHQQLNQTEVLQVMRATGLRLVREFVVGDKPYILNAPEQCELKGWLFKK